MHNNFIINYNAKYDMFALTALSVHCSFKRIKVEWNLNLICQSLKWFHCWVQTSSGDNRSWQQQWLKPWVTLCRFEPEHCQENVSMEIEDEWHEPGRNGFQDQALDLSHILSEFIAKCILTVSSLKKMLIFIIQSKPKTFEKESTKRFQLTSGQKLCTKKF